MIAFAKHNMGCCLFCVHPVFGGTVGRLDVPRLELQTVDCFHISASCFCPLLAVSVIGLSIVCVSVGSIPSHAAVVPAFCCWSILAPWSLCGAHGPRFGDLSISTSTVKRIDIWSELLILTTCSFLCCVCYLVAANAICLLWLLFVYSIHRLFVTITLSLFWLQFVYHICLSPCFIYVYVYTCTHTHSYIYIWIRC